MKATGNNARLTVLVENTARDDTLSAEHGLAFWLELGPQRVLFDTGQSDMLCENADRLGIDLAATDAIVLSHGHYDHTGGLAAVLAKTGRVKAFAHPAALEAKYARNTDGTGRDIGMPARCKDALQETADIILTEQPTQVADGLYLTGTVPRHTDFEDTGGPFFKDPQCRRPDALPDDQAAFLDTPRGLLVLLGCAHAGIVNTLRYISALQPKRPIHTLIGGTHLVGAGRNRMDKTVAALRKMQIQRLMPLHCTGAPAAARLGKAFLGRVSSCPVGTVIEL